MRKKFIVRFTILLTLACAIVNCFLIVTFVNLLSRL